MNTQNLVCGLQGLGQVPSTKAHGAQFAVDRFLKSRRHKVVRDLSKVPVNKLPGPRPRFRLCVLSVSYRARPNAGAGVARRGGLRRVMQPLPGLPPTPQGSDGVWSAREATALDLRTAGAGLWLAPLELSECRPAGGHTDRGRDQAGQRTVSRALCAPVRPTLHLATGLTGGRSLLLAFLRHLGQVLPVHPDPPRDAIVPTVTLSDLSFHAGHQQGLDTLAHVTTLWPLPFHLRDPTAAWQTPETKCVLTGKMSLVLLKRGPTPARSQVLH